MADTITKGKIGEEDLNRYDGVTSSFSRPTSTGGTLTIKKIGYEVDVLLAYGGGSSFAFNTIKSAVRLIGATEVTLLLRPGIWIIDSDLTIGSNFALRVPKGATLEISSGKKLTINGTIEAGSYQIFTGEGSVDLGSSAAYDVYPAWWGNDLSSVVSAIGSTTATVEINSAMTVSANLTIPTTMHIKFGKAGVVTVDTGVTLTINGPMEVGKYQIFSCSGTGVVVFGVGYLVDIYPEWWGIDGTADDVQINQAIQAASAGATVWLSGAYSITSAVSLNKTKVSLKSRSVYGASLSTASDINGIVINARYVDISNIFIHSTYATPTTSSGVLLVDSGSEIVADCRLTNIFVQNFAYGIALYSSTVLGISYNEIVGCWSYQAKTASIAITANGASAWVTENHFWGGWLTASATGCCVYISGGGPGTEANQNVFNAMCFQGGDPNQFAITDYGTNVVSNCRFEVDGHGMYVYNASAGARSMSRYYSNLYGLTAADKIPLFVRGGVAYTDTWFGEASLNGLVLGVDVLNTTVDDTSNSGQKVLSIAATTGLFIGSPLIIDEEGTPEYHMVASVSPGVSVTLEGNLVNTHTAGDAHTVKSWGCFYGQVCWPQESEEYTHYFSKGEKILILDASTNAALGYKGIGVRSESGGLVRRSYENTLTLTGATTDSE